MKFQNLESACGLATNPNNFTSSVDFFPQPMDFSLQKNHSFHFVKDVDYFLFCKFFQVKQIGQFVFSSRTHFEQYIGNGAKDV